MCVLGVALLSACDDETQPTVTPSQTDTPTSAAAPTPGSSAPTAVSGPTATPAATPGPTVAPTPGASAPTVASVPTATPAATPRPHCGADTGAYCYTCAGPHADGFAPTDANTDRRARYRGGRCTSGRTLRAAFGSVPAEGRERVEPVRRGRQWVGGGGILGAPRRTDGGGDTRGGPNSPIPSGGPPSPYSFEGNCKLGLRPL